MSKKDNNNYIFNDDDLLIEEKPKAKRGVVSTIILIIAIIVFVVSAVMLGKIVYQYLSARHAYSKISNEYVEPSKGDKASIIDFDGLKSINSDVVAWIDFEKEPEIINYPIVKCDDNEHYLHYSFEGKPSSSASIFEDCNNNVDFSDKNIIIYGHNMNDRSMFANLRNYVNSGNQEYLDSNKFFYIYLPDKDGGNIRRKFQIFSTYIIDSYNDTDPYIIFDKNCDTQEYLEWALQAKDKSTANSDLDIEKMIKDNKTQIITLSTCTNVSDSGRAIVHGILVEEVLIGKDGMVKNN